MPRIVGTIVVDRDGDEPFRATLDATGKITVTGCDSPATDAVFAASLMTQLRHASYSAGEGPPGSAFLMEQAVTLGGRVEWPPDNEANDMAKHPGIRY